MNFAEEMRELALPRNTVEKRVKETFKMSMPDIVELKNSIRAEALAGKMYYILVYNANNYFFGDAKTEMLSIDKEMLAKFFSEVLEEYLSETGLLVACVDVLPAEYNVRKIRTEISWE